MFKYNSLLLLHKSLFYRIIRNCHMVSHCCARTQIVFAVKVKVFCPHLSSNPVILLKTSMICEKAEKKGAA